MEPTEKQIKAINNMSKTLNRTIIIPNTKYECIKLISELVDEVSNLIYDEDYMSATEPHY